MGALLTKRRAVDLCRVAACLCCRSWSGAASAARPDSRCPRLSPAVSPP